MLEYLPKDKHVQFLYGIIVLLLILWGYFSFQGYDFSINWYLTSTADSESVLVHQFEKGPFNFEIERELYLITEKFYGGNIVHNKIVRTLLALSIWAGFCGILSVSVQFKRIWFLGIAGLSILFVNFIDLDSIYLLGSAPGKKWVTLIFIVLTVGPAYILHEFYINISILIKWIWIFSFSISLLIVGYLQSPEFTSQFIANSHLGVAVITILFIFFIAEEIIFAILYLITKARGGRNNEKHFAAFSIFYLGLVGLYYVKKAGIIRTDIQLIDPIVLLTISILIALWSVKYKQPLLNKISQIYLDIRIFVFLFGIVSLSYFCLVISSGNDPGYAGMHYLIIYAHLGFGTMYFAFIILNFVNPMIKGFQIYKIAYEDRNFPYVSARLGGFVAVLAFFFLSDNESYKQLLGARYNYQGDYYLEQENYPLAAEYFRQGSIYAWDNHYSSYQLGQYYLSKGDLNESIYRFARATKRNPSPYAYVNEVNALEKPSEITRGISILYEGLTDFPNHAEISNNLALLLNKNGSKNQAFSILNDANNSENWNDALEVNSWSINIEDREDPNVNNISNNALKANILFHYPAFNPGEIDTASLNSASNLHTIAYTINSNYRNPDPKLLRTSDNMLKDITNESLHKNLHISKAFNYYTSGNINQAFREFDIIQAYSNNVDRSQIFNIIGKLALEQHAPLLAIDNFEKAIDLGHFEAKFNKCIAQMEAGKWVESKASWNELLAIDSTYIKIYDLVKPILENSDNDSFSFLYYHFKDLSANKLIGRINELSQKEADLLWDKIFNEESNNDNLLFIENVRDNISDKLSSDKTSQTQSIISQIGVVDSTMIGLNAFDETSILSAVKNGQLNLETQYKLLNESIEINPYSVPLLKTYTMVAISMGLNRYADNSLIRLSRLVPLEDFLFFEREFNEAKEAKKLKDNEWSF